MTARRPRLGRVARLAAALILAGSTGCSHGTHLESAAPRAGCDGPADVCAFLDRYLAAFNARSFEAFRATFADDITAYFDRPFPPERLEGRAAVEQVFGRIFARYHPPAGTAAPPLPPPWVPVDLHVQAYGNVAVLTFLVRTPDEVARRTLVVRRRGEGWTVVHIHASSADLATK